MEEAVSSIQTTIFTLMAYAVGITAFSYLFLFPVLNQFGINRQVSSSISKVVCVLLIILVFSSYF